MPSYEQNGALTPLSIHLVLTLTPGLNPAQNLQVYRITPLMNNIQWLNITYGRRSELLVCTDALASLISTCILNPGSNSSSSVPPHSQMNPIPVS